MGSFDKVKEDYLKSGVAGGKKASPQGPTLGERAMAPGGVGTKAMRFLKDLFKYGYKKHSTEPTAFPENVQGFSGGKASGMGYATPPAPISTDPKKTVPYPSATKASGMALAKDVLPSGAFKPGMKKALGDAADKVPSAATTLNDPKTPQDFRALGKKPGAAGATTAFKPTGTPMEQYKQMMNQPTWQREGFTEGKIIEEIRGTPIPRQQFGGPWKQGKNGLSYQDPVGKPMNPIELAKYFAENPMQRSFTNRDTMKTYGTKMEAALGVGKEKVATDDALEAALALQREENKGDLAVAEARASNKQDDDIMALLGGEKRPHMETADGQQVFSEDQVNTVFKNLTEAKTKEKKDKLMKDLLENYPALYDRILADPRSN